MDHIDEGQLGPQKYLSTFSTPVSLTDNAIYGLQTLIGDAVVVRPSLSDNMAVGWAYAAAIDRSIAAMWYGKHIGSLSCRALPGSAVWVCYAPFIAYALSLITLNIIQVV